MTDPMQEIEKDADALWRRVLEVSGGDEEAAMTVMKAHADIALDSNLKRRAQEWLEAQSQDTSHPSSEASS